MGGGRLKRQRKGRKRKGGRDRRKREGERWREGGTEGSDGRRE